MPLMTMIARVVDGLPLVGSVQQDEKPENFFEYQIQAKTLFKKIGPQSPARCTIETGPYLFHYLIENDTCYLVLCEKMYSKHLAFKYLEKISQEFYKIYGTKVNTVTRPYAFIEFDFYIQSMTDGHRENNQLKIQNLKRNLIENIDIVYEGREIILSEEIKMEHDSSTANYIQKEKCCML